MGMRFNSIPFAAVIFVSACFILGLIYVESQLNQSVHSYSDVHSTDTRMFFHEVSGRPFLTWRELCSVEAAARYNPSRPVQLFMSSDSVNRTHPWFETLSSYSNVEVISIDNARYFEGTPLEKWYERKAWRFSEFEVPHLAQYIRLATLYKGGGQYLDLDMLLFKTLDEKTFRNYFSYNSPKMDEVESAAFHLTKGHRLIEKLMTYLSEHYDPRADIYHGLVATKEVLESHCHGDLNSCPDVKILPHEALYPIPWFLSGLMAKRVVTQAGEDKIGASNGIHLYHNSLVDTRVDSNVLFAKLARKHCPRTVAKMKECGDFFL